MDIKVLILIYILTINIFFPIKSHSKVIYEVWPDGKGLSSLKGAMQDIENRLSSGLSEDISVILDDGTYYLDETIVFDKTSGNNYISFIAKEGASPIISGGCKVINWERVENRREVVKAQVNVDVSNLWVNDKRMKKSSGFVGYSTGIFERYYNNVPLQGLLFPKKDFPHFKEISGLELRHSYFWRNFCFKVSAILDNDSVKEIPGDQVLVVLKDFDIALSQVPKNDWIGMGPDRPYYFENSLELLDEAGEWCYTPCDHTIYYFMQDDEDPDNILTVIPNLEKILLVKSISSDKMISNVVFKDVEFSHNEWTYPIEHGFVPHQGSKYYVGILEMDIMPAAITVENARNVKFETCKFTKLSSNGIHLKNNTDGIRIENCEFIDLSGTAVCVSDYDHSSYSDRILPVNTIIHNNLIKNIGVEYNSCAGLEVFYAENLTISHNELYNCSYTGISVGWGWTIEPSTQKNVKILYNKIIGDTQKCSDGGAIYSLSNFADEGLLIQGNYIDEITLTPVANTKVVLLSPMWGG